MTSDLALSVNTVKGQPEAEIERFTAEVASRLVAHDQLECELRRLLEPEGVCLKADRQEFLVGVILACILADIGTELSPWARAADTAKIRSICAHRGLQYAEVVRATSCADMVLRTIDAYTGGD